MKWIEDSMMIRNDEIPIKRGKISHSKLKFYKENPRLFSLIRPDQNEPDQAEIQTKLQAMEHVKALVQDIKSNGGLLDPIIVREGTWDVLEGNSRLAAYRRLADRDPIGWGEIECILLPRDIDDSHVFALLGQYHIIGKKDWAPYEQAGFLYRQNKVHGISKNQVAQELGLSSREVSLLIKTYQLMIDNKDTNINKWSYYYEFQKSRKIAGLRQDYDGFEAAVIGKIKSGGIEKAVDVRDKLPKLAAARKKVVQNFVAGEVDLNEAMARMDESGNSDSTYQRLKRTRNWLVDPETEAQIERSTGGARKKIKYEVRHLAREFDRLRKALGI